MKWNKSDQKWMFYHSTLSKDSFPLVHFRLSNFNRIKMAIDWEEINAKLPFARTDEDKEKRKALFKQFDPNENGYLSLAEVLFLLIPKQHSYICNRTDGAARIFLPPSTAAWWERHVSGRDSNTSQPVELRQTGGSLLESLFNTYLGQNFLDSVMK